ncbi:MAG: IPT/TIG domain-containing protein [Candidatus Margulisiibacteriota bacterium]
MKIICNKKKLVLLAITAILLSCVVLLAGCSRSSNTPTSSLATSGGIVDCYVYTPIVRAKQITSKTTPAGYMPLEGARVSIAGYNTYDTTNSNGYCSIPNLSEGRYTVLVGKSGYETVTYENVNISNSVTTTIASATGIRLGTSSAPGILDISSTAGPVGTPVIITGINFGSEQEDSTVTFSNVESEITTWEDTEIICTEPEGAETGNVAVNVDGQSSNTITFAITDFNIPGPMILSIAPTSGSVGTSVTIAGSNFGSSQGTSRIFF